MNFTSNRLNVYDTWTTNRYLLPPRSKMHVTNLVTTVPRL
jgi:hypothetical protein